MKEPSILDIANSIVNSYAEAADVVTRSCLTDEIWMRAFWLDPSDFDTIQRTLADLIPKNSDFFIPLHWIRIGYYFSLDTPNDYSSAIAESTIWLLRRDPLCQTLGHPVCDTILPNYFQSVEAVWRELLESRSDNVPREMLINAAEFFKTKDGSFSDLLEKQAESAQREDDLG